MRLFVYLSSYQPKGIMKMRKLALLLVTAAAILSAADISGKWNFNLVSFGEEIAHANVEFNWRSPSFPEA